MIIMFHVDLRDSLYSLHGAPRFHRTKSEKRRSTSCPVQTGTVNFKASYYGPSNIELCEFDRNFCFAVEIPSAKIYFRKAVESIKQQFKSVRRKTVYNMRLQDFRSCENCSAFIKDANLLHGADSS